MRLIAIPFTLLLGAAIALAPSAVHAADAGKVDQLMTLMKMEENTAQMQQMMIQVVSEEFNRRAAGENLTPQQQQASQAVLKAMQDSFAEMFAWEEMGPEYRRIYAEVLTDEEVDGAIAYYSSPAGAAMLSKMPVLMQRGMEVGQRRAQEAMPKMQAEIERAMQEIKSGEAE